MVSNTAEQSKLLDFWENAIRIKATEYVRIVEAELDARFPNWRRPKHAKGADPTFARFKDAHSVFPSQIQAYLWLVDHIVGLRPGILEANDWRTEFVSKGRSGHFFARTPFELWDRSPHLVEDTGHYATLCNGWFASTNLSRLQKLSVLYKLAAAAEIPIRDWEFRGKNEKMVTLEELARLLEL